MEDSTLKQVLSQYGKVHMIRNNTYSHGRASGMFNGIRTAKMEIKRNIPSSINICGHNVTFLYSGQRRTCFKCGRETHMAVECNMDNEPRLNIFNLSDFPSMNEKTMETSISKTNEESHQNVHEDDNQEEGKNQEENAEENEEVNNGGTSDNNETDENSEVKHQEEVVGINALVPEVQINVSSAGNGVSVENDKEKKQNANENSIMEIDSSMASGELYIENLTDTPVDRSDDVDEIVLAPKGVS